MTEQEKTANPLEGLVTEDAMAAAQRGEFQHTFFEMWENVIGHHIRATESPLTLEVAASILTAYPWLEHSDLLAYRQHRLSLLRESLVVLQSLFKDMDHKKKIYKQNKNDWTVHKDLYLQLAADWNNLTVEWGDEWSKNAMLGTPDGVSHAAIGDISAFLLNDDYGLITGIKNLKDFSISPEDREKLNEMTGQTSE